MPFPVVPVLLGGGALAALALLSKSSSASTTAALPGGSAPGAPGTPAGATPGFIPPVTPPPQGIITPQASIADIAGKLGVPPSGVPQPPGTVAPTMADLIDSLRDPAGFSKAHPNVSFDSVTNEQLNAAADALAAQNVAAAAQGAGQKARVTTNDPPPSGDLIVRVAPSEGAAQVGGAEKDGTVTVVEVRASPDGVWSNVVWAGGSRLPAATGFVKRQFLTLI